MLTLPAYEIDQRDNGLFVRNPSAPYPTWHGPYESTNDVADAIALWVNALMVEALPTANIR